LASADTQGHVRIWDAASWRLQQTWRAHEGAIWSLASGFDGEHLASGGNDGACRVWDLSGRLVWEQVGLPVGAVAFSPDGHCLAVGRKDGTVQVWNSAESLSEHD
jgi:WD40 repeat protein